jgi:hypothetical protein
MSTPENDMVKPATCSLRTMDTSNYDDVFRMSNFHQFMIAIPVSCRLHARIGLFYFVNFKLAPRVWHAAGSSFYQHGSSLFPFLFQLYFTIPLSSIKPLFLLYINTDKVL